MLNFIKITSISEKVLHRVTSIFSKVGQVILMVMVLLTILNVVLRRIFNHPLSSSLELSQVMLVIVVFSSVAYCVIKRSHVRIDALTSRFSPKTQAILNCVTGLFGALLFGAMGWGSIVLAMDKMANHSVTGILPIPVYPFVFLVSFGSILLALMLFVQFIDSLMSMEDK